MCIRDRYNYLPFMILPIYSVIIKLDGSLLEAARDLGASSMTVFRRVILPLSLPGVCLLYTSSGQHGRRQRVV